jgi:hypothetical protein
MWNNGAQADTQVEACSSPMNRSRIRVRLALAPVVAALVTIAACRRPDGMASIEAQGETAAGSSAYDAETTDIARVLAGMRPLRGQAFTTLVQLPEWREWESESRDRWGVAWSERVQPVRAWANISLEGVASDCRTLLHPFGGAGFLAAYMLFPSCEAYVLVGTEPMGQLPSFEAITPAQFAGFAEDVRRMFPDVFPKDGAMRRPGSASPAGLRLSGAIPSLLVQLARLNARVVSAARFDITTDGRPMESIPIRGGNARPAALSLTFEVPNGRPQSLVYFPADLDDAAIRRRPGAWTFLRLQAPFATLLAPSHMLPRERFSLLLGLVRDHSRLILQAEQAWVPLGAPDWIVSTLPALPASAFCPPGSPTIAVRQRSSTRPAGTSQP